MVILVDKEDNQIGLMEKMEAHQKGLLHRAFSVLIFNERGEILLQKRASSKYHSGGLWTNACCSHPLPDEELVDATKRRLIEEMGIRTKPKFLFKFIYKAELDNDLVEYEYDHVFTAVYNEAPVLNPEEAEDWKYVDVNSLKDDIKKNPNDYTVWFKIIVDRLDAYYDKKWVA